MTSRFMRHAAILVFLSFVLSISISFIHSPNSSVDLQALRRAKTIEPANAPVSALGLLGLGIENAPVFSQGLAVFQEIEGIAETSSDSLFTDVQASVYVLYNADLISEIDKDDAFDIVNMAVYYAQGIRRDQVKEGDDFRILRFNDIKGVAASLQVAFQELIANTTDSQVKSRLTEEMAKITAACQMAALWVTSPVSSTPMLEALAGGRTTIMAVNARYPQSIPGVMLAAQELGAPVMFEIAMSESNLEGGYTGQTPEAFADAVRYWAALLGFDLPYAIHADHTTVAKDTADAIEKAKALNQAQLAAGFTSFAIDPSSLPAVRETNQLAVFNKMDVTALRLLGIREFFAHAIAAHGEYKKMEELRPIIESFQLAVLNSMLEDDLIRLGMGKEFTKALVEHGKFKGIKELSDIIKTVNATPKDVDILMGHIESECGVVKDVGTIMNYIESKILVGVLDKAVADGYDFTKIPRISQDLSNRIIAHGNFSSLSELEAICGDEFVYIEGIDEPVKVYEYLKTYLDLKRIIEINEELAKLIPSDLGLEVEVGHVGRIDPLTGEAVITTPLEAVVLIESLKARGINPQLIAVNNGTKHGNVYDDKGNLVPTSVDIKRTAEIAQAIRPLGVTIAQHGTTGTPYDTLKNYLAGNLLKGNVGTFWQNIALANMPEDLFKRMAQWTVDNYDKEGKLKNAPPIASLTRAEILANGSPYAKFLSDNIKNAIKPFKTEIDSMPVADMLRIIEAGRQGSYEWYNAFNARDKIWDIIDDLGWGWESPYAVYITDQALLDEANLINILRKGEGGSLIVDRNRGTHIARLSRSGARILTYGGLSNAEVLNGISEGKFEAVSQQYLIDQALAHKDKCILAFTGGGDSAGINAVISAAASQLKGLNTEMTVLGVENAGAGLIVAPENFRTQLILIDDLLTRDMVDQASTALGSSRINPFKIEKKDSPKYEESLRNYESAMRNINGFGGFICTGGDDNLKTAAKIAELNPDAFVFATAKTIDGDVMVNNQTVRALGFDSAAAAYRSEIYSIAQSAFTHGEKGQPMVMFVEAMGRDAGRLAFESARGDVFDGLTDAEKRRQEELRGTILILTPEYAASLADIEAAIRHKIAQYKCCTVVVAEGYTIPEHPEAGREEIRDHFGNVRLGGVGQALAGFIEPRLKDLKVKVRANNLLTYEGRGAMPTELDRIMGIRIGARIASLIAQGVTGGRFVGYTNAMNPLEEDPIVTELSGISNGNTLKLYPREVLLLNGVIMY